MLAALPGAVLLGSLLLLGLPPDWAEGTVEFTDALSAAAFSYLTMFLPVLLGGVLHQILMVSARLTSRPAIAASSAVILVPLAIPPSNPAVFLSWLALPPLVLGAAIYLLALRHFDSAPTLSAS
jgi:hypothetical protein